MEIEPGANLGFSRLRWSEPGSVQSSTILLVPPRCDFAPKLMQALEELSLKVIDTRSMHPKAVAESVMDEPQTSSDALGSPRILVVEQSRANFDAVLSSRLALPWVTCFDDACASVLGNETIKPTTLAALVGEAEIQVQCIKALGRHSGDLMIISLRKMREFPEHHLRAVMHFLGLEPSVDAIRSAESTLRRADDPHALSIRTELPNSSVFQGTVNRLCKNGIVAGWVKDALDDRRVEVRVFVDGNEVAQDTANYLREDLNQQNLGDAAYGFAIDISSHLNSDPKLVEVRTADTGFLIGTLEMTSRRGLRVSEDD